MTHRPQGRNAAARLYLILERARSIPGDTPAPQGWAEALQIEPRTVQHWLQIISSIDRLVASVEAGIAGSPHEDAVALGLYEVTSVRERLPELNMTIGHQLQPLHDTGMQALLFCSSLLGDTDPLSDSSGDLVPALLERARALRTEIADATEFSPRDRQALLEAVEALEQAILAVELVGMEGVAGAADALLGAVVRRPSIAVNLRTSPAAKGVLAFVTVVDLFLNGAANLHELTAPDPSPVVVEIVDRCDVTVDLELLHAPETAKSEESGTAE